jgi:uncharacterized protein
VSVKEDRVEAPTLFDLRPLHLKPGDVRRERVAVEFPALTLAGQPYTVEPNPVELRLEFQRSNDGLYLKLAFEAGLTGPCYRCLEPARCAIKVRASEYQAADPQGDDHLVSDYVDRDQVDIMAWATDELATAIPEQILCRPDCAGLCPRCGEPLVDGDGHDCGSDETDTRWDALRELL